MATLWERTPQRLPPAEPLSDHLVGDVEIAAARILRLRLHALPLTTDRSCLGRGSHA